MINNSESSFRKNIITGVNLEYDDIHDWKNIIAEFSFESSRDLK